MPSFGDIPEKFVRDRIVIDRYSRIRSLESGGKIARDTQKHEATFEASHLCFLDYDELFFGVERFKRERGWYNFNISKARIYDLLSGYDRCEECLRLGYSGRDRHENCENCLEGRDWYRLVVPELSMEMNDIDNISIWQDMAFELLRKYCDAFYNYSKSIFMAPRLELVPLRNSDGNIPVEDEYYFIGDIRDGPLMDNLRALESRLQGSKREEWKLKNFEGIFFDEHLYEPLVYNNRDSGVEVSPLSLNESEYQFVKDLRAYLECCEGDKGDFYLLRNRGRGRGVGFFEAGNFYPDFILWQLRDGIQYIAFIDPHGLQATGPGDRKITFHKDIKNIEKRLSDDRVCLSSFIVTPSDISQLKWDWQDYNFHAHNVYFMSDKNYISAIIDKMAENKTFDFMD